jgi:cyclohexanone monooxygenase
MSVAEITAKKPVDKEALKAKYRAERDKRLRDDGIKQYVRLEGHLHVTADDPYTPFKERAPKTDHVTFAFIGGGFAGLVAGARLAEAGVKDVRIIDKAGDFGGTWYWNRYPGAQCDTASMVYMPLLEETGHRPSEKYAHAPEILQQCRRIGKQFGLYDNALFHTEVKDVVWQEKSHNWLIKTNRSDAFTAQFIGLGTGPLHVAKLPGIPGIEKFKGHAFHTSRWDYDYTGGNTNGAPLDGLSEKRVAIIGTGATAVQAVPHLAGQCKQLYVVQRTPSSVDVRDNRPIDPDWFKSIASPGWQQRWLENFTQNQAGGGSEEDWVQDGWTDLSKRIRARIMTIPAEQRSPMAMWAAWEDSDFEKMEEIRARAETVVKDGETADKLKAWYRQLCKRPCFHDEYLQAFNKPRTKLIDTDGQGVEAVTEKGFVVGGKEYEVDCIIYASGFEVGTEYTARSGFEVRGRNGQKLSDAWAEGMRSKHGIHVHGFPNLFFSQPTQGANLISNVPHNLTEAGKTIALIVREALDRGAKEVEVSEAAQKAWIELILTGPGRMLGMSDCTPGYYNNEGQPASESAKYAVGYPAGAAAYFKYLDGWRNDRKFDGLEFR